MVSSGDGDRAQITRWLLGAVASLSTVGMVVWIAVPSWDPHWMPFGSWIPTSWLFFGIALLGWIGYTVVVVRILTLSIDPADGIPFGQVLDEEETLKLADAQVEAWRGKLMADPGQLDDFATLLLTPRARIRRISESVQYVGRSVEITMSLTIDPPHGSLATMIVPVLMRVRGELTDGLAIVDGEGKRLSTMTRSDTAAILTLVMDRLIEFAVSKTGYGARRQDQLAAVERAFARSIIASRTPQEAAIKPVLKAWEDRAVNKKSLQNAMIPLLEAYAILADSYPLLVIAPTRSQDQADLPVRITVARTEMPFYRRPIRPRFVQRVQDIVASGRRFLGVHSPVLALHLANADRAHSYHLAVTAPDGLYVESSHLRWRPVDGRRVSEQPPVPFAASTVAGSIRVASRQARPYAHFYVQEPIDLKKCEAVSTFRESPPGSVGDALVTSGLFAVIIPALSFVRDSFQDFSDVFVLLIPVVLTAVGVTSIWQGVIQTRLPYGGRAAARIASIVTLVLALLSVALVIRPALLTLRGGDNAWLFEFLSGIPFDHNEQWSLLVAAAVTNFLIILVTWGIAVIVEMRLLNSPDRGPKLPSGRE